MKKIFLSLEKHVKAPNVELNQVGGPCFNNQILTGDYKITRASTTTCYMMIFFQ